MLQERERALSEREEKVTRYDDIAIPTELNTHFLELYFSTFLL